MNAPSPGKMAQVFAAGTEHVVTLQTDFLMTDPQTLRPGRPEDLEKAYRDFWTEVSGEALWNWFATSPGNRCTVAISPDDRAGRDYEPFLVTDRGSTFVLEDGRPDQGRPSVESVAGDRLARPRLDQDPFRPPARAALEDLSVLASCRFRRGGDRPGMSHPESSSR